MYNDHTVVNWIHTEKMEATSEHTLSDSSSAMSASLPSISATTTENGDTLLSLSQLTANKMV